MTQTSGWSEMDELLGPPLLMSMVGERIWDLHRSGQLKAFDRELTDYFARAYPDWRIVSVEYPIVYLRDQRR
ncbi:Uncharacterised protein [Paenibacillus macerans]|uniref:Uncharacterized protein n=1 Tax=Paenibacillus macerans TaxID=44252 RepID=A0A090Y3X1_PAEMA|nr:hypothetical protein DJ90_2974 [Paenibacillus macerans]SUA84822.1 Uncharacterised protein [Paenibacillus macerans]